MISGKIGIIGMGLLGRGIAACFLAKGFHVVVHSIGDDWRRQARHDIAAAMDDLVCHACAEPRLRADWIDRYRESDSITAMYDCEFMIESVAEDLAVKRSVLEQIESVVGPTVPIATNTSSMPITLLQQNRRHPERIIGMHWAAPCHVTKFLEIIRGERTDDATTRAAVELGAAAGKEPCLVNKDVPGFIVNRLGYAIFREALALLEAGVADVQTIDRAFQHAIGLYASIAGPFRWMDLTGLAPYVEAMGRLFPQLNNGTEIPATIRALVEGGAKGITNGRGFYSYSPEQARLWQQRLLENVWRVQGCESSGDRTCG
jgi:3-hydroxybutyryl-CoA dehydrogenase